MFWMAETDAKLLDRYVRATDAEAFSDLANRYRVVVFAAAWRITRNSHDAEDVTQACFLELARRPGAVTQSVAAYLHAAATRKALNLVRDRETRQEKEQRAAGPDLDVNADPAEKDWNEVAPEVDAAIESLPEKVRVPLILFYLRGMTHAEIAREMQVSGMTVKQRLKVGVRMLRQALAGRNAIVTLGALTLGLKAGASMAVPCTVQMTVGQMALAGLHRPAKGAGEKRAGSRVGRLWVLGVVGPAGVRGWVAAALLALVSWGGVEVVRRMGSTAAPGPYDQIALYYAAPLRTGGGLGDDLGLVWRMATRIGQDPGTFWRGSQPLFFAWSRRAAADWLADRPAYVLTAAEPDLDAFLRLDAHQRADQSAVIPVQLELLHGLVSIRLADGRDGGESRGESLALSRRLCESYRKALVSPAKGFPAGPSAALGEAVAADRFVNAAGAFRSFVSARGGKVTDVLRPASGDLACFEGALEQGLRNGPGLCAALGAEADPDGVVLVDVRRRVRLRSIDTQGQEEFVLRVRSRSGRLELLELKRQLPAAAELAGCAEVRSSPPAKRVVEDVRSLLRDPSLPVGWCTIGEASYTLRLLSVPGEPTSRRAKDPGGAADAWALAGAASHSGDPNRSLLASRITPALAEELARRADAYIELLGAELEAFRADPRVARDQATQDAQMASWVAEAANAGNPWKGGGK